MRRAIFGALLSFACLTPARDRAERDSDIGTAEIPGLRVEVALGLAAIRSLTATSIELWQSAPHVAVRVTASAPGPVELCAHNSMPTSRLVLEPANGGPMVTLASEKTQRSATSFCQTLEFSTPGTGMVIVAPEEEAVIPFRIAVLSDVQEAVDRVGDIYRRINAEPGLDFLLGAGDLTDNGSDAELARFERELEALSIPYYTTLGNHELGVIPPPFQERFGRASFSFEHRGARFTLIDSASATVDALVLDRLEPWLVAGSERFHVVAMHIPPVDPVGIRNGSFASRNEATLLLAQLAAGGVDLTLYGHIHSYYAFRNAGIEAHISGGGGAIPQRFDGIGRHFLLVDIDPVAQTSTTSVVEVD